MTKQVAEGDLNVSVQSKSKDEIGRLANNFNAMIGSTRDIIMEVKSLGNIVNATTSDMMIGMEQASIASDQVATTISDMASGASDQSEATHQGSEDVNNLVDEISEIADYAKNTKAYSEQAISVADDGKAKINIQKEKMAQNKQALKDIETQVMLLDEKSNQIGQIVELISSIAQQTNLLALNAAIEAARAGEQGKGFAVVADEVRKLAEGSNDAANEISTLIGEIQEGVQTTVKDMELGMTIVTDLDEAAHNTETSFEEIYEVIGKVSDQMVHVSNSAEKVNLSSKKCWRTHGEHCWDYRVQCSRITRGCCVN